MARISNNGIVDISDKPYDALVKKMTEINQEALDLHQKAVPRAYPVQQ